MNDHLGLQIVLNHSSVMSLLLTFTTTENRQLAGISTDETEVCVLTVYRLGGD